MAADEQSLMSRKFERGDRRHFNRHQESWWDARWMLSPSVIDQGNRNLRDTAHGGPGEVTMKILGWTSKRKTESHS